MGLDVGWGMQTSKNPTDNDIHSFLIGTGRSIHEHQIALIHNDQQTMCWCVQMSAKQIIHSARMNRHITGWILVVLHISYELSSALVDICMHHRIICLPIPISKSLYSHLRFSSLVE